MTSHQDAPARAVPLLPNPAQGWPGRPALTGHRPDGSGWLADFVTETAEPAGDGLVVTGPRRGGRAQRALRVRGRGRWPGADPAHAHQRRRHALSPRRPGRRRSGARPVRRAARPHRAVVPRADGPTPPDRRRPLVAGRPGRQARCRRPDPAQCAERRGRIRARRGLERAPGVERQLPLPARTPARRAGRCSGRGTAAQRRGGAGAGSELLHPVGPHHGRPGRARFGGPAGSRRPADPAQLPPPPARHPQRVGGGLLRPRPGAAVRTGRAGRRGRGRALRARRRLVRLAPRRQQRVGRLDRVAATPGRTGSPRWSRSCAGTGWSSASGSSPR